MEDEIVKIEKDGIHVMLVARSDMLHQFLRDIWHGDGRKWVVKEDDE